MVFGVSFFGLHPQLPLRFNILFTGYGASLPRRARAQKKKPTQQNLKCWGAAQVHVSGMNPDQTQDIRM
jgi:hypothetical protein